MCLRITPGGNRGTGHFYLAKNRTFLLCVDIGSSARVPEDHCFSAFSFNKMLETAFASVFPDESQCLNAVTEEVLFGEA
jgi:hypothetical protein